MTDLVLHRLAFGGFTLTSRNGLAERFLRATEADFLPGDACMEGLPDDAKGFEPYRAEDIQEAIAAMGLTVIMFVEDLAA